MNTLKQVVTRLILDFEDQEKVNHIEDFAQKDESKAQAYRRLLELANTQNVEKVHQKLKKPSKESTLTEQKR